MKTAFPVKIQERRAFWAKRLTKAKGSEVEKQIFLLYFPFPYPNPTHHLETTSSHLPHEVFPDSSVLADLSLFLEHHAWSAHLACKGWLDSAVVTHTVSVKLWGSCLPSPALGFFTCKWE